MTASDPAFFHRLYGLQKPRVTYYGRDFIDYALMVVLSALAVVLSYGSRNMISIVGLALCAFSLAMFIVRHGVEFSVPMFLKRPQDALYLFMYKLQNLRPMYFVALGLLLLENLLIAATPNLPHHVALMRTVAFYLFYIHLIAITLFRTAILISHLVKKELVREVLMQTPWKRVINAKTNMTLEVLHAYGTGLLTHIVLLAPWYLVITYASFSVIFLPAVCVLNVVVQLQWAKTLNSWFYRDHWVGHNSELEFLLLHGTHHDAIPSGMIAVAGNGLLEGFLRNTLGFPNPFYNPVIAAVIYTFEVKQDIDLHQYIPGVFPRLPKRTLEFGQHSAHHYGRLEPYGFGLKLDQPGFSEEFKKAYGALPDELMNSIRLDEELTGFEWDNPTQRDILSLWDKYQKPREPAPAGNLATRKVS